MSRTTSPCSYQVRPRRAQVAELDLERCEHLLAVRVGELLTQRDSELGVVVGVGAADGVGEVRLGVELLGRVRADRLQHRQAGTSLLVGDVADEAVVHERADALEHVDVVRESPRGALDVGQSRAYEHREHLKHPALGLGEELGAPLDRASQRALPRREVAPPALQHVEPFVEPPPQLVDREQRDARGGELDRERQPVEPAAGGDDVGRVLVRELEVGPQRDRALDEQLDRLRCERILQRDCAGAGGERERRHREQPLAAYAQRRTAGHERGGTRAVREQLGQAGRGLGHLLEVVEHEQQLPLAQAALEHLEWRVITGTGDRHGANDGSVGALGLALGAQVDEEHAVLEAVDLLRRRLQREPGLAGPTRTGECHQPRVLRVELRAQLAEQRLAPEERRRLRRQVVRPHVESRQRRERVRQARPHQLEEVLGGGEVLQAVRAEVTQVHVVAERPCHEVGDRRGQQDLPTVRRGHHARGSIDGRAVIVAPAGLRLADVCPHAHAQRSGLAPRFVAQPLLRRKARSDRVRRRAEHGHEPVASCLHDRTAAALDRGTQNCVVARQRRLHGVRVALPEPRTPLDVGEEVGQARVGGHIAHATDAVAARARRTPLGWPDHRRVCGELATAALVGVVHLGSAGRRPVAASGRSNGGSLGEPAMGEDGGHGRHLHYGFLRRHRACNGAGPCR